MFSSMSTSEYNLKMYQGVRAQLREIETQRWIKTLPKDAIFYDIGANVGVFSLLAAAINMLMGSASAKWALMAPIFVPMFMFLGYSPELTQVGYRIGDSVTNVISPMMSFFALIIAFMQKYVTKAGIGTVMATMLPYSIVFFILWTILIIIWILLGLPLGPGADLYYNMPVPGS